METTTLYETLAVASADVTFTELLRADLYEVYEGPRKLRISIRSNEHQRQSHARVELWDGNRWNEVATIDPANMLTEPGLCYRPEARLKKYQARFDAFFDAFEDDRDNLIHLASLVLA